MPSTALVTGASVGIGHAFAQELAARGHNLVVVARDEARLNDLAKSVAEQHSVNVEVMVADLTDEHALARVEERLRDDAMPIDVLVNNAGFGSFGHFADLDVDVEARMVALNVTALLRLTHAALPGMIARGAGGVLNVSSLAGFQPSARIATYGATKAFVTSFTQAVHEEVLGTGVKVSALCPGFTRTEFQERSGSTGVSLPDFVWQTPEHVAALALDALDRNKAVFIPGALNKVTGYVADALPGAMTRKVTNALSRRLKH